MPKKTRIEFEIPGGTFSAIGLAALSGVRSMAGPTFLSRAIHNGDVPNLAATPFATLASDKVSAALKLLLVGEMIEVAADGRGRDLEPAGGLVDVDPARADHQLQDRGQSFGAGHDRHDMFISARLTV